MLVPAPVAPLIDFLFPPRCPLCGAPIAAHGALCGDCWQQLVIPGEPACALCNRPFVTAICGQGPGRQVCGACLAEPPRHDGIAAATLYNDASRQLILAFKRGRRIALAPLLARMMLARLRGVGPDWLVVPVPLHPWRLWARGFNQSVLLGREIARGSGARLAVDGLVRVRPTPSLGGLGRRQRAATLQGAIRVNPRRSQALRDCSVLLVDDVMTSGATSTACVRALKRAGATRVVIACFARVLDEAMPGQAGAR